ncbi:MAG TPA: hypothetical protein VJJ24_03680 [Candidatus Paceibacterota bacterium]
MSTFSKLLDVFYSGSHSFRREHESVNEIAFLIDNGYLAYKPVQIATKIDYFTVLKELSTRLHESGLASGGSSNHVALKIIASKYLKDERRLEYKYEQPFCGYYPDVLSEDNSVVIECGNTQNPEKILTYFRQGQIKECLQIPYPDVNDTTIIGYSFAPHSDLNDFLVLLEKQKLNDLRAKLKGNRRATGL